MATLCELDEKEWGKWVKTRPKIVRENCEKFPPNKLYRLKNTGHRVTIGAYAEDGTMRVYVSGDYNLVAFERQVFGIKPEDLEECDLPTKDEMLGSFDIPLDEIVKDVKEKQND